MKRILVSVLLVAPLIYFGGRLYNTFSVNSAVNRFWSGWKLSQAAPLEETLADEVRVEDKTGFLTRLPYGVKTDVIRYFTDEPFWWGTSDPQKAFNLMATEVEQGIAVVKGQVKANISGRDYIYTLEFTLIKDGRWDITRIAFVDIL